MEWDQKLFKQTWNWLAGLRPQQAEAPDTVKLEDLHARLTLLARMLCGEPVEILRAEQEGGVNGPFLYLPAAFALGQDREQNCLFYLFRVVYLSVQRELGLNWPPGEKPGLLASRQKACETSQQVLALVFERYPAMQGPFEALLAHLATRAQTDSEKALAWGHWFSPSAQAQSAAPSGKTPQALPDHAGEMTSREAPAREEVEIENMDKKAMQAYTLMHQFEKVETIEEFQGTWRDADGSDELAAHAEALNEVDLRKLTRCDDTAHAVLQAEFISGISVPEVAEMTLEGKCLTYDEWDGRKRAYRRDWCKVYPRRFTTPDAGYLQQTLKSHQRVLQLLRNRFSLQFNTWQTVRRQAMGEEPDLDALVENFADRQAGRTPSEKIYLSQRKKSRAVSLLLLMDLSLSSDGYTGGFRVLDVEKQAVILFAQLLSEWGDRFQIDGFASHTRNQCEYLTLKAFDEPWERAAPRIGAVEPRGYTRIGPALRHATTQLAQEQAKSRWILLLSDGKPNDYDRYEGQYGLADVRQAIREARQQQVQVYALAIESLARNYLPQMLGTGGYRILPQPALLPQALAEFYGRLVRA